MTRARERFLYWHRWAAIVLPPLSLLLTLLLLLYLTIEHW